MTGIGQFIRAMIGKPAGTKPPAKAQVATRPRATRADMVHKTLQSRTPDGSFAKRADVVQASAGGSGGSKVGGVITILTVAIGALTKAIRDNIRSQGRRHQDQLKERKERKAKQPLWKEVMGNIRERGRRHQEQRKALIERRMKRPGLSAGQDVAAGRPSLRERLSSLQRRPLKQRLAGLFRGGQRTEQAIKPQLIRRPDRKEAISRILGPHSAATQEKSVVNPAGGLAGGAAGGAAAGATKGLSKLGVAGLVASVVIGTFTRQFKKAIEEIPKIFELAKFHGGIASEVARTKAQTLQLGIQQARGTADSSKQLLQSFQEFRKELQPLKTEWTNFWNTVGSGALLFMTDVIKFLKIIAFWVGDAKKAGEPPGGHVLLHGFPLFGQKKGAPPANNRFIP